MTLILTAPAVFILTTAVKMTSNNGSRKRRRVAFEEDSENTSGSGRVDDRDKEEDDGVSLDQRNEEVRSRAPNNNVSSCHVDEVTGDGLGASRREGNAPAGSPRGSHPDAGQILRDDQDRDKRHRNVEAGHRGDGRTAESWRVGDSTSQRLSEPMFYDLALRVQSGMMKLVSELPQHERMDLGLDGTRWRDNPNSINGTDRDMPPGMWTSIAVVELFTGTIQRREILNEFIMHALHCERSQRHSLTNQVIYMHMPVDSSIAEPDLEAISAAAKSAYFAVPSPASTERSPGAVHSEAVAARKVGTGPGNDGLTEPTEPPLLFCDVCNHDGTHSTGRCAMVTSEKHGDTNTDPFCDCSCSRAQDRHGNPTHCLQRSQDFGAPRMQIVCAKLAALWEQGHQRDLFEKFVVERRRMAPLLVYTKHLCFVRLAIAYAEYFCDGEVPKALEGMWPYTKADAIKHKTKLRRFYEIGMENMPAGELEGLSIAEIRARYESGRIPPQCRVQT